MNANDKSTRAAWATLTHDNLDTTTVSKHALTGLQFFLLNFGLLLGNILVLFNTGAFASVTLHATGDLGVSPSHGSWFQTYYFISLALALPASSWAAASLGEVRLYLFAMIIMALASLLCALTGDLQWFLFGRVLQGFFGGLTIPLSQNLLMREYSDAARPFAVSLWSIAALTPFTLGPAVGGWVADQLGWRWLLYLNIPLPLITAGLVWAILFDRRSQPRKLPFDLAGFALLASALFCLQTVLNRGQDDDWFNSLPLMGLALVGLLMLAYFVIWELAERRPLLDLRLFSRRNFAIGSILLGLGFMLMYGMLSILLVRLQVLVGYTSFLAGSVLLPLIFLAKPLAALMHRIVHRFDARLLASINMLLFAAYCGWSSRYDFFGRGGWFDQPLWSQVLEGFCLGGLFVPLTTVFLSGLNPKRQTQAVELGGMLRILGGSVASPLFGVLWERRTAFHQAHLSETFSSYDGWQVATMQQLQASALDRQQVIALLSKTASQHAAVLGLDDAYRLSAWVFLGLAALVWLADPARPKQVTRKEDIRLTALEELMEEP